VIGQPTSSLRASLNSIPCRARARRMDAWSEHRQPETLAGKTRLKPRRTD
jgi:hypothetical protein